MKIGRILYLGLGLSAMAFGGLVACGGPQGHGPEKRCKMDISTLTSALRAFEMDAGVLPTSEQGLDALVNKPTEPPVPERWKAPMKKEIRDRWGNPYQYRQPGIHNPDTFDLWSLGPDGIESGDDIGNWE